MLDVGGKISGEGKRNENKPIQRAQINQTKTKTLSPNLSSD
jgi:hypothetical protein